MFADQKTSHLAMPRSLLTGLVTPLHLAANAPANAWGWLTNVFVKYEDLLEENQQLKKDLTQARRERDRAKKKVENICASRSYRVGRMITFIPRKVRGGYRCLKEHGVKYTVRRIGQKMGLL